MENRITVKLKNPNPLFEKWLTEWRDQAKEKNSKSQHSYSLALSSLRKYPLPLERGKDCKILKGFGTKLCDMLDDALKKHKSESHTNYSGSALKSRRKNTNVQDLAITEEKNTKARKIHHDSTENVNTDDYIPAYRSGAYAILIALYKNSLENNYEGFMLKKDIIKDAQIYCDTSFTKAQVGSYYTSWNSMKTLITKNLVDKRGNPAKFSLTEQGVLLGSKLYTRTESEESTSTCVNGKRSNINNEFVVLSDSEDDDACSMNYISEQSAPVSNELNEICGVFSKGAHVEDTNVKASFEPCEVEIGVDSTTSNKRKKKTVDGGNKAIKLSESEDLIMAPYTFEVLLFVDTRETSGQLVDPKNDMILSELERLSVKYEVRTLKVGDYCWICRDKMTGKELIAPYIIERKRMDDLASSIKDGRYYEQKFRIKKCGLQNIIYMVESYGTKDQHVGLPLSSLNQAIVNTLIQDGFVVKIVDGVRGLAEYLSCMSNLIKKNYENKTIVSCPKENIANISLTDDLVSLMFFQDFNKHSSKIKNLTVKEMFIRQLLKLKGLSVDRALAIVEEYPTPKLLKDMILEKDRKSVNMIANIKYGKLGKKIGPSLAENLYMFYRKDSF